MKKILAMLAVLSLIGAVHAQKKAKPAAKPAAKIDAAKADADAKAKAAQDAANAKAADVQNKANEKLAAATAVDESKFAISVWGGYGIATASDYTKYPAENFVKDSGFTTVTTKNDTQKRGGVAGGVELLYGGSFQFGAGFGYLTGLNNTIDLPESSSGSTFKGETKMNFLPAYAVARYFVVDGLYVGAGLGIAMINGGSQSVSSGTNGGGKVDYTGRLLMAVGKIGYDYKLSQNLSLGLAVNAFYLSGNIPVLYENATGNYVTKDVNASHLNIVPSLAVTMAF